MSIHLSTPIAQLTRVGAVTHKRLAHLGITTVKDLLEHYPTRFEDYRALLAVDKLREGMTGSIAGQVTRVAKKESIYRKMKLTEAWLDDGHGAIKIVWFNQPFMGDVLREGERIVVAGKVERDYDARLRHPPPPRLRGTGGYGGQGWVLRNPLWEKPLPGAKTLHTARLIPVYPATYGLTQKQLRFLISQALSASSELGESMPSEIIKTAKLASKPEAIHNIHEPRDEDEYQKALRRLKFEELFLINLATETERRRLQTASAPAIPFQEQATKELVVALPFKLTDDQRKVAWRILQDMSKARPMNRLLQGEVGSGKTVVAAIAALNAAENGWQTAIMAPTEILALQHFATISKLFPNRPVALLTNKYSRLSSSRHPEQRSPKATVVKDLVVDPQVGHEILRAVYPDPALDAGVRAQDDALTTPPSSDGAGLPLLHLRHPPSPRLRGTKGYGGQVGQEGSAPRDDIKRQIAEGLIDITIGTHAIIQNDVIFHKLGLIVIDEQHRFGVEQRKMLKSKSQTSQPKAGQPLAENVNGQMFIPHLLSMTATPIPRSLALTLYGDLDISTIRQMPIGRKAVQTRIVDNRERAGAYEFIKQRIAPPLARGGGEQAFVVCPLIEESDSLGVKAATAEYEKLTQQLAPITVGLLHGRLKSSDKEKVMNDFKQGKISVLVTTAVVEVGVDVPNATIMIIEGADRFGLAQLHQFRGRVGRSDKQSYCLLFTDSASADTRKRLTAFRNARDGFEIAELDLKLRGPGQIYGTTQSGWLTDLKIASLTDTELISETKKYAQALLEADPELQQHPQLRQTLAKYQREMHWE